MDIKKIKIIAIQYRRLLKNNGITPEIIILFGSYANNSQRPDSDIDLAVVSQDLGKDRFKEGSILNRLSHQINPKLEVVPIGLNDYFDKSNISPILHQIKNSGTPLI